jgi:hypothetical protein
MIRYSYKHFEMSSLLGNFYKNAIFNMDERV